MKTLSIRLATIVWLFFGLQLAAQNAANPVQVALKRWYQTNQVTQFTSCNSPNTYSSSLAFDGVHVWVGCTGYVPMSIEEYDASDGTLLKTITTSDINGSALVYDGENIWSDGFNNDIIKVNASTGTIVASYPVGTQPYGLVFDGQYIWVANYAGTSVSRVSATTGAVTTYSLPTCAHPQGLAFDGSSVWVSCSFNSKTVLELNSTGGIIATITVGNEPAGLAFDGTNIWVANSYDNTVSRINVATKAVLTVAANVTPWAVTFDTKYIWVTSAALSNCTVTKLQPSTASLVGTFPAPCRGEGIVFDGGNIWVADYVAGTISKF
jgi:YVTN family beta-propeller protein